MNFSDRIKAVAGNKIVDLLVMVKKTPRIFIWWREPACLSHRRHRDASVSALTLRISRFGAVLDEARSGRSLGRPGDGSRHFLASPVAFASARRQKWIGRIRKVKFGSSIKISDYADPKRNLSSQEGLILVVGAAKHWASQDAGCDDRLSK
jgi:hypothetical protein